MIEGIRRLIRRRAEAVGFLAVMAGYLFSPAPALAFDVADPLTVTAGGTLGFNSSATLSNNTNGTAAGLSATLAVGSGGTNLTSAADDNTMIGNGTTWQSKALTNCTGAGKAVTYDASTNAWGCNTISGTSVDAVVTFRSETKIQAGSTAVYLTPDGGMSTTENDAHTPFSAGTFGNLRCNLSAASGGSGMTVFVAKNTCGSAMTFSGSIPNVTVSAANTAVADTTNTLVVSANECVAIKVTPTSTTTAAYLKCSLAKTSN